MLSVKPIQITNEEGEELIYKEAKRREQLAKQLTNVFTSANQMTRTFMSTATTTTLTVKQKFDDVRAMQKYNEEKEAAMDLAAQTLEAARLQRLEEEKAVKEGRDKRVTDRSNKFFTKMAKELQAGADKKKAELSSRVDFDA